MTTLVLFYSKTGGLPWSRSILGLKDSLGVVLSQDKMTTLVLFYSKTEGLPWSRSILGFNDSPGVVQS